ncbi:hypothetical protein TEA_006528 [Camellia sinensis var. sinensis]|uniref:Probable magnesium transporter n=1 Tax=Camellia sinensis var. sinensis TaxID=542762 RepID=A0A4S4DZF9_CAMSN|nr:hypothetical protein TEA_006528 [Camellia sinensis var. sinensis]
MGERLSQIEIVETETPNAFVYTLNFPNVRRNDWNVFTTTISQINLLEIYGKQTGTKESGSFNRFWMLPRNVKRNNMQVKKEDGMVTVTFPKRGEVLLAIPGYDLKPYWQMLLPFSYAIVSGAVGSCSVLFAKSLSNLLRLSMSGGYQLHSWFTYSMLLLFLSTAGFWMARLNEGLSLFDAILIVPMFQIAWTFFSICTGFVYFQEYQREQFALGQIEVKYLAQLLHVDLTVRDVHVVGITHDVFGALRTTMFILGMISVFIGISLLAPDEAKGQKDKFCRGEDLILKARYCMYGSFEAGVTRRAAQLSLHDHKLCSASCIVLHLAPASGRISYFSYMGTVDTPFLTVLKTWTSPFEHPVITHVCARLEFPKVSARVPCLRISELSRLVSGFAPNTYILPLRGRKCHVRHPHTPPAVAGGHRLVFSAIGTFVFRSAHFNAGRHSLLPVGTVFCRNSIFGQPTTVHPLFGDILCQL